MKRTPEPIQSVAIACGGTGGHLFPGMAVAEALRQRSCRVTLLVSPKEVDQHGAQSAEGVEVETLPAVALQNGAIFAFARGFWKSYRVCARIFARRRPQAVLAMGGFTSAPAVMAGRHCGAATFLHESNAVPGRANRWLSFVVDEAFVGFSEASRGLFTQAVRLTGTPVRSQFTPADPGACRIALGLDARRHVLLVMGGSQGAHGINELMMRALPELGRRAPALQFIHLSGQADTERVAAAYRNEGRRALVRAFLTEMELALGAATLAVGRAGASSLAELAAMRLPAILIPYPSAADNHQFHNARALVKSGAALQLDEPSATPERLAQLVIESIENSPARAAMSAALGQWFYPDAAEQIAQRILEAMNARESGESEPTQDRAACGNGNAPDLRSRRRKEAESVLERTAQFPACEPANRRHVLDCASPLALSERPDVAKSGRGLPQSKALARTTPHTSRAQLGIGQFSQNA